MATAAISLERKDSGSLVPRVASAALVVGILDGLYVLLVFTVLMHATTAMRLFQGIARSLLGKPAFDGGMPTALLGVLLHFAVALSWTLVWAFLYQRSEAIRRWTVTTQGAIVAGVLYGVAVWLIMDLIILRLTRATPTPVYSLGFLLVLLAHVTVIGPVIALLIRHDSTASAREVFP